MIIYLDYISYRVSSEKLSYRFIFGGIKINYRVIYTIYEVTFILVAKPGVQQCTYNILDIILT